MSARNVPLAPSAFRGAPLFSRVTPEHREWGWVAGGRERRSAQRFCGPLPQPGTLPKAIAGQKVYTGAGTGETRRRAGAVSRALEARLCSLLPSHSFPVPLFLCPRGPGKGDIPSGGLPSPRWSLPGPQVGPLPAAPGTGARGECERSPQSSRRPPEALE